MRKSLDKLLHTKAENILVAPKVNYSFMDGSAFPLVIRPHASGLILREWVKENKDELEKLVTRYGAVLFRDFGVDTVDKFHGFISTFDASPLEYKQRSSPRYEVARNIYHSTTYPADQPIQMHSENSYAIHPPDKIVFCCITPAAEQGETPIADNRRVLDLLQPSTRELFLQKGVRYIRNITSELGLSWQEVFQTDDRLQVAKECAADNLEFEWKGKDGLKLTWSKQAIWHHPLTQQPVWFNHAFFFNKYALDEEVLNGFAAENELPFDTRFGDGTEISREIIEEIRTAYREATVLFPWEKGDVLFLDNMLISHGRSPYKGQREIIVSMF